MKQWDLLHLPIHMCSQKFSQNSRRQTAVCEWKKFHRYKELHEGVGQRVTWYLTYECCLGNTKGENSCEKSYLKLFFQDMSVGFCRPWIKRKGKIRKGHVCFGSGKLCFYQKKGISDKIWKTTTERRLLVWQHCSCTPGGNVSVSITGWRKGILVGTVG